MHTDGHLRRSCGQSSGWWIMIFTTDLDRSTVVSQKYKSIGDLHVPSVRKGQLESSWMRVQTQAMYILWTTADHCLSMLFVFPLKSSNLKLKCRWPCQPWRLSALR